MDDPADCSTADAPGPPEAPSARYADWKAPPEDGRLLVWPDPPDLLRDTADNGRRLRHAGDVRSRTSRSPKSAGASAPSSATRTSKLPSSPPATRPNCTTPACG